MSNEKNAEKEIAEEVKEETVGAEAVKAEDYSDVYRAESKAGYISGIVALVLTIIFYSAQYLIDGTANYGLCATVFGMLAAEKIVVYAKLKGRRNLILAILYALFALLSAVMTFVNLLK